MAPDNGARVNNCNVQLPIEIARILQKRGLVFQVCGLLTSGSFNCDKKESTLLWTKMLKAVYKAQLMKSMILHCMENFDQSSGKM